MDKNETTSSAYLPVRCADPALLMWLMSVTDLRRDCGTSFSDTYRNSRLGLYSVRYCIFPAFMAGYHIKATGAKGCDKLSKLSSITRQAFGCKKEKDTMAVFTVQCYGAWDLWRSPLSPPSLPPRTHYVPRYTHLCICI